MKLLIFLILLVLVVLSVNRMQKKMTHKEFLMVSKTVFFVSSFNFFTLISYHLLNALNEINRLQFTDLSADLNRIVKGTSSVVLIGLFLYFLLFSVWLSIRSMNAKRYSSISSWLVLAIHRYKLRRIGEAVKFTGLC